MEFKGKQIQELEEPVVFRAFNNKNPQPVKLSPCEDETGKLFTGQGQDGYFESLSQADLHKMSFVIDHSTKIAINDGKVLKPTNMADRENWRWIQLHPYIVINREQGSSSRMAVFYVENRKAEAAKRVALSKLRDKARYLIQYELSYEKQLKVARTIGHPAPEGFSPMELTDYLLTQSEAIAPAILKAADPANDEQSGVKIALHELIRWKIIDKYRGGVYRFGGPEGVFVGHNEEKCMEYLTKQENQETVAAILAQLEHKKEALATSPATV